MYFPDNTNAMLFITEYLHPAYDNRNWIGYNVDLHLVPGTTPREWEWGTGPTLSYNKWGPGQPNHFELNHKVTFLQLPHVEFNNCGESFKAAFICEKHLNQKENHT